MDGQRVCLASGGRLDSDDIQQREEETLGVKLKTVFELGC